MFPSSLHGGWNLTPFSQATSLDEHTPCFPQLLFKWLFLCHHWIASPPHLYQPFFINPQSFTCLLLVPFLTFLNDFTTDSYVPPQCNPLLPATYHQHPERWLYNISPLNNLHNSRRIYYHSTLLSLAVCIPCWRHGESRRWICWIWQLAYQ